MAGALKVWDGTQWVTTGVGLLPAAFPDLVSKLNTPVFVSHRGGALRFPEQTMDGYRQSAEDGFVVECDVMPNAAGVLVTNHDDTVDRTWVNSTGSVLTRTTTQWTEGTVQPPMAGGNIGKPTFWNDLLDELGGRAVLMPEIKSPATNWTLAQRTAFYSDIVARGLSRSIVVQCFTYSVVLEAVARGIRGLFLGNTQTPAQMAADGVWGVGLPNTTTSTEIASYKAAGIKVLIYTIDTRAERTTWIETNGADGIFSNDIWWTSKRFNVNASVTDPTAAFNYDWTSGVPWPGLRGNSNLSGWGVDPRGEFVQGGWSSGIRNQQPLSAGAANNTSGIVLGFAGPRGPSVQCRSRIFYTEVATTQTRWAGIFWGNIDPEVGFSDDNTQAVGGYHLLFRRNGELVLFRKDTGSTSAQLVTTDTFANAPTVSGPAIVAGAKGEVTLELEVNATNVVGRLLWGGTTMRTITIADTTYRPTAGYFQLDVNAQIVEFRDIEVRSLA
jgi:glycerophosphoryl diester phosphodiesterase